MINSHLFKHIPSIDTSGFGGKKLYYNLKQNSLPVGTMTEKIAMIAAKNNMRAYIDGDKELIFLSQKINMNNTSVCVVDFSGNVIENGTVQGRTNHGNTQYKPFYTKAQKFIETQNLIKTLLGESPLAKIALSKDYALLEKVLRNKTSIDVLHFAQEFKTFAETQNDWDVRAIANEVCELSYKIIEAQGRSNAECAEK